MQKGKSGLVIGESAYSFRHDIFGSRKWTLRIGLLILLFLYLYAPIFAHLAKTWWIRDDYSHGFLVPFISLYLIWYRWERFERLRVQPAFLSGLLVVMAAGIMLLLGKAGGVITLQALSLVMMMAGLVLCFWGRDYLSALSFPIAYLLFMIPIADYLLAPLHWSFQLMTAKMGVGLLQAFGFAVYLENQYIVLPRIILEVAKACSGINYLISIIAIGIPLAYVTQKNVWCRVVLVVSAVIIGVMANWMRVAAIGVWAYYGGEVVHGPFHVFQGLFVANIGFIALFAGAWLLAKVPAPPSGRAHFSDVKVLSGNQERKDQDRLLNRSWLVTAAIFVGLLLFLSFYHRGPVPLKSEFTFFPFSIENWSGEKRDAQNAMFRVPGADHELVRRYKSPAGAEIQLYVAYFESQNHSKEIVNYLTAPLHDNATEVDLFIAGGKSIRVNQAEIKTGQTTQRAFFWYDLNGKTIANRFRAKIATTLDALIHGRTNGALVLVTALPKDRDDGENLREEEIAFIREVVPVLDRYLP